jgi:hypothetical protein
MAYKKVTILDPGQQEQSSRCDRNDGSWMWRRVAMVRLFQFSIVQLSVITSNQSTAQFASHRRVYGKNTEHVFPFSQHVSFHRVTVLCLPLSSHIFSPIHWLGTGPALAFWGH